jgi:hypothetical protein
MNFKGARHCSSLNFHATGSLQERDSSYVILCRCLISEIKYLQRNSCELCCSGDQSTGEACEVRCMSQCRRECENSTKIGRKMWRQMSRAVKTYGFLTLSGRPWNCENEISLGCSFVGVDRRFRGGSYLLHHDIFIALMMEAVRTFYTSVCFHDTTRLYIPESFIFMLPWEPEISHRYNYFFIRLGAAVCVWIMLLCTWKFLSVFVYKRQSLLQSGGKYCILRPKNAFWSTVNIKCYHISSCCIVSKCQQRV